MKKVIMLVLILALIWALFVFLLTEIPTLILSLPTGFKAIATILVFFVVILVGFLVQMYGNSNKDDK